MCFGCVCDYSKKQQGHLLLSALHPASGMAMDVAMLLHVMLLWKATAVTEVLFLNDCKYSLGPEDHKLFKKSISPASHPIVKINK